MSKREPVPNANHSLNIAMVGQKGIPSVSGGIEKHVEEISVRLKARGHTVTVFTRSGYTKETTGNYRGVRLKQIPHLKSKHLDAISHTFLATLYIIFHHEINMAHYHSIGPCLVLPFLRLFRPGLKIVATYHSQDYLHGKWNALAMTILRHGEWSMCRFAHEVIAVSRTSQQFLTEKYRRLIHHVPNGSTVPIDQPRPLPADLPLEPNGFFLVVARLIPVKCIDDIISAFQLLVTDKFLVIAGESSHTDRYAAKVKDMAATDKRILFTGYQTPEQLARLYSNAFLYINASSVEGLSIAVLEAMSYGCATLVSDIDNNLEIVGTEGLRFKQGDVEDLRQKISELLMDTSRVEANRQYCTARFVKYFDWDEIIAKIEDVYTRCDCRQKGVLSYMTNRLFCHDKWAIGLLESEKVNLEGAILPTPVQWIKPRFGQYIADPFIFNHNDQDYLLYELFTYSNGKGKIAVAELIKDASGHYRLINEQFILHEIFHQSYPLVFSHGGKLYCLPEQAESNSLRLYRAHNFPTAWVLDCIIINDFPVIDPTLFFHEKRWWLFGTRGGGQEDSRLYAWFSDDLHGPWHPHAQNPIKIGLGQVRPAGPMITVEGQLYRPVQAFSNRYGDGLLIMKILELSPESFHEETIGDIEPFPDYHHGLHHICIGDRLTVVDGNGRANPWEVGLKLLGIVKKKFFATKSIGDKA